MQDCIVPFSNLSILFPYIRKNAGAASPPCTVRYGKAVSGQRLSASCRFMPELRRVSKQHGIPLYEASCLIVAPAYSAFCPYLAIPGQQRHGQTGTLVALHGTVGTPLLCKAAKVPLLVCPADHSPVRPAYKPLYRLFLYFYTDRQSLPYLFTGIAFLFSPFRAVPPRFYQMQRSAVALDSKACSEFLENSSFLRKSNFREKPSHEALPTAGTRIHKIPEAVRQKEPTKGKRKNKVLTN